jgi:hypothetical protein
MEVAQLDEFCCSSGSPRPLSARPARGAGRPIESEDWDSVKPTLMPGAGVAGPDEAKMAADGFAGCELYQGPLVRKPGGNRRQRYRT